MSSFYTWKFFVGYNPHAIVLLASSKEEAIEKALRCLENGDVLRLEGPYTKTLKSIKQTVSRREEKDCSLEDLIKNSPPTVTSANSIISVSALDG